jgi:hypothetical protein
MKYVLSIVGAAFAVVLIGVSMAMNGKFGYSLGRTELDGMIYGAASIAADGLKVLGPFFIVWGIASGVKSLRNAGIVLIAVCGIYSFISSVGFSAANRITTTSQSEITQTLNKSAIDQLKSDQAELARVRKKLAGRLGRNARIDYRKKETNLQKAIAQSRKDLGFSLATVKREAPGKAQQEFLQEITSFASNTVTIFLVLLVSALVEIGSTLGLFLAIGHFKKVKSEQDPKPKTRQDLPQDLQEPKQEILQDLEPKNLVHLDAHSDRLTALDRRLNPGRYSFDQIKKHFAPVLLENNWQPNNLANKLKGMGYERHATGTWEKPSALAA